jgi:hypothetical protein
LAGGLDLPLHTFASLSVLLTYCNTVGIGQYGTNPLAGPAKGP